MMTRGYHEMYLNKAMANLGDAFDYSSEILGMEGREFANLFVQSTVSARIENGEPLYLVGKSGVDYAVEVIEETTGKTNKVFLEEDYGRSPAYWCGWILAYYQWFTMLSFKKILSYISYDEIRQLYEPLHEADLDKVVDTLDQYIKHNGRNSNLARIRKAYGCTQQELSEMSGVSLRSIQMYEQGKKDINKSQSGTLLRLSKALGCHLEDLLETNALA